MPLSPVNLEKVDGKISDTLLYSKNSIRQKDTILRNLRCVLAPNSSYWQSTQKNGRSRVVIGPEGTGLIGGRGNKIVPSIPWESDNWSIIREFITKQLKNLEKKKIIPKNSVPTVLINYYPNGSSGIVYHRDRTDNCLGTIVSYTFGPENMARKFLVRNVVTGNEGSIILRHGDSLIMKDTFNENFEHAVETMKKSTEGWDNYRYNITIRFITDIKPKKIKKKTTLWTKETNGIIKFSNTKYNLHLLGSIKFIPSQEVYNYSSKYLIRFKNWGNVGDYITDKNSIVKLAEKKKVNNVNSLPDFYIYVPSNRCFKYLTKILSQLKTYFTWKYPRNNRTKVGKIDLGEFIDILFNFYDCLGNVKYSIPINYKDLIHPLLVAKKKKKPIEKRYGFIVSDYGRLKPQNPGTKGIIWAKNCKITVNKQNLIVPGLNLQYPYAGWLVDGEKTIETRTWKINEKLLNKYIAVIETPGKIGKKNGVDKARIIGYVKFKETKEYTNDTKWAIDKDKHKCNFKLDGTII